MLRYKVLLFLVYIFLVTPAAVFSAGPAEDETIKEFRVDIEINQDSSLSVTETIIYDFGSSNKHGIFRDIPLYSIQDGKKDKIALKNISVVDENDGPYNFERSKILGGKVRIKIGDSDKLVTGVKTYKISYLVKGAVMFLDDRDEIYWNATGNDWKVPIEHTSVEVYLPLGVAGDRAQFDCYVGAVGSLDKCAVKKFKKGKIDFISFYQDNLPAQAGLTVAVGLPVGTVDKPGLSQRLLDFIMNSLALLFPIAVFVISYAIWKKRGRDPKSASTIVTQFDAPDKLTPLEVGILADYRADDRELAGELIYLAIHGYIKIKQIPADDKSGEQFDYELEKIEKDKEELEDFQKILIDALFGSTDKKRVSKLRYKFGEQWSKAQFRSYQGLVEKKFLPEHPLKLRDTFYVIGGVLIFLFVVASIFGSIWLNVGAVGFVSAIISIVIIFIFGRIMPARTESGQRAKEHIEGLKIYLNVAEKDRLNFHNAPARIAMQSVAGGPEKKPEHFEALLPFAIVLGVEKKWAGQFDDIVMPKPDWYDSSRTGVFSASNLVGDLRQFRSVGIADAVSAEPNSSSGGHGGSSGGGSSGGGHGGGGGGSW